jgi:hypothetical protein
VPSATDVEVLLEDLAWRVGRTDPDILADVERWHSWSRLEVRSAPAPRVCILSATGQTGEAMNEAFLAAGWRTTIPEEGPQLPLSLGEICLDPDVAAVAVGISPDASADERAALPGLWDLVMGLGSMRDDLVVIACGPLGERPDGIPGSRMALLPAPEHGSALGASPLREAAREVGIAVARRSQPRGDSRQCLRASILSLAGLLDRRVDGLEVGASAGSRTRAAPGGEIGHLVLEAAALVPASIMEDDAEADRILRWSTLSGEPLALADRLRNLRLNPWREASVEGARLRLAALKAALARLDHAWSGRAMGPAAEPPDLIVVSGGAFSAVPAPAAALAVVDTLRRPGPVTLLADHARILAPIGSLPDDGDRRRLLADLLDDALLPLGSAILTGELRSSRGPGRMVVSSPLGELEIPLLPGGVRPIDLPPGITARVDLEAREGNLMGMQARYLTMEVTGGLAGLLLDTRDIPLRLPDGAEQRRAALEAWEGGAWAGAVT